MAFAVPSNTLSFAAWPHGAVFFFCGKRGVPEARERSLVLPEIALGGESYAYASCMYVRVYIYICIYLMLIQSTAAGTFMAKWENSALRVVRTGCQHW